MASATCSGRHWHCCPCILQGNRAIEDDIVLHEAQGLTEPQASITDVSNGPAGLIINFDAAALLDCLDDVERNTGALLARSIDLHLVDDHTREGRVGIEA